MFERFTDRARKVIALANQEAQRFNHEYIGTEHVLLGLVKEGSGIGANCLKTLEVDLRKVRLEVEKLVKSGPNVITMGKLPHTPRTKKMIEYAIEEARNLKHNYVGTEHLLLGLIREQDGIAAQILMNLGLKLQQIRDQVEMRVEDRKTDFENCNEQNIDRSPARPDPGHGFDHWEYSVQECGFLDDASFLADLNNYGSVGWEAVHIDLRDTFGQRPGGAKLVARVIYKRRHKNAS